jgi:LmbE family N-acetylglucosaminyl deacetylase
MRKLYSVEAGHKQNPRLTRILSSVVVLAETKDEALQFARQQYPEALSAGTENRVREIDHVFINWPEGETVVIEKLPSRQFHC